MLSRARAHIQPRIAAQTTGPEMPRAYIESNLEFIRDNPTQISALIEIVRATIAGARSPFGGSNRDGAVHILAKLLARSRAAGELRPDFDATAIAIAIRAVIDAAPGRLGDPAFNINRYASEAVAVSGQQHERRGPKPDGRCESRPAPAARSRRCCCHRRLVPPRQPPQPLKHRTAGIPADVSREGPWFPPPAPLHRTSLRPRNRSECRRSSPPLAPRGRGAP